MTKDEAMNLFTNADLTEKKWNITNHKNLLPYIKNSQRNYKIW